MIIILPRELSDQIQAVQLMENLKESVIASFFVINRLQELSISKISSPVKVFDFVFRNPNAVVKPQVGPRIFKLWRRRPSVYCIMRKWIDKVSFFVLYNLL